MQPTTAKFDVEVSAHTAAIPEEVFPYGYARTLGRWHSAPASTPGAANRELREAHRRAWEAYLPRLVIRAEGDDPGSDPHA
jgi:hypothetical protein